MANDHDKATPHHIRTERLWLVFVGLALGYAVSNPLMLELQLVVSHPFSFATDGWVASQALLLGIWAALGPGATLIRLAFVLTGLANLLFCSSYRYQHFSNYVGYRPALDVEVLAGQFLTFAVIGVLAYGFRRFGGWRIDRLDSMAGSSPPHVQFDLKHALGMMTLWAVICAAYGRAKHEGLWDGELLFIGVASVVALPAMSLPLLLLRPRVSAVRVASALLITTLVSITLFMLAIAIFDPPREFLEFGLAVVFAVSLVSGALACGFIAAGVLRWAGYRLEQIKKIDTDSPLP